MQLIKRLDRTVFTKEDAELKTEDTIFWIALLGDRPVGYAGLRPLTNGEPYTYFTRAGVLRYARGKGIHRRLIRVRLAWTKRHGYEGAMTYTVDYNLRSANNLIRAGFELFAPSWEWAGEGCLYFFKELS